MEKGFPTRRYSNGAKKRCGRAKYLLSVMVDLCGETNLPAKLVFIRNKNKKSDYLLISTDTSLSEQEIIQLYGKQWDIEVFFMAGKSGLNLTGEGRSSRMTLYAPRQPSDLHDISSLLWPHAAGERRPFYWPSVVRNL